MCDEDLSAYRTELRDDPRIKRLLPSNPQLEAALIAVERAERRLMKVHASNAARNPDFQVGFDAYKNGGWKKEI